MTKYCFGKSASYKLQLRYYKGPWGGEILLVFIRKGAVGSSGGSRIIITDKGLQLKHSSELNCQHNCSSTGILLNGCSSNF